LIDNVDIATHAKDNTCPDGRFSLPVPNRASEWPRRIRLIAKFKRDGERGVGDTLARRLGAVGGEVWKKWYEHLTGTDCGCGERQARLNARYPY
jgi:hypothetical protein